MRAIHLYSSAVLCLLGACTDDGSDDAMGDDSNHGGEQHTLAFHGEIEAFPGFSYDTGALPAASPVQLQLTFSAAGKLSADAQATVGGAGDALAVAAVPGSGKYALDAHVKAEAILHVHLTGVNYDGPIPGIDNFDLSLKNETTFDPFLLGGSIAKLAVNLPETELPPIPLGSIPGKLIITVSSASTVNSTLAGTCAGLDQAKMQFLAEAATNATIVLKPKVVISVPLVGDKEFAIPEVRFNTPAVKLPMDLGTQDAPEGGAAPTGVLAAKASCAGASCKAPEAVSFTASLPSQIQHNNQCSSAQIYAYISACITEASTRDTCQTFLKAAENSTCSKCMLTDSTAAKWGALVDGYPNIGGCIALRDPMQKDLATKYAAAVQCEYAACGASCADATYEQWEACAVDADGNVCSSYIEDAYNAPLPTGAAAICVDQGLSGEDFIRNYANLFCGSGL